MITEDEARSPPQAYNSSFGQRMIERLLGSALTGTITQGAPAPQLGDGGSQREHRSPVR